MTRKRVLIVDDSKTALMMSHMILKRSEYDVMTATSGKEAVEKAASFRPDLILLDVVMPEMDGFAAARAIRESELRDVPIIMVTTRGEAENIERGYSCGCNEYVTKPVDPTELLAKVQSFLGVDEGGRA
jgi:CheY-like chemotaxis protein